MKSLFLALNLALLLFSSACQVKESSSTGGLFSGHAPATNSFVLQTLSSRTYVAGDSISLSLTFPFPVIVTGNPQISLTVGSTTRFANYFSGDGTATLTFTYPFVLADNDADGIVLNGLALNGGTLTFVNNGVPTNCDVATLTSRTLSQSLVDNTGSTISALALTNIPGFFRLGQTLNFAFTFSEAVYVTGTPRIAVAFTTGGSVFATYTGGSGSTSLSFSYTIPNTTADYDGFNSITSPVDLNSGTIKDASGNNSALTFSSAAAITSSLLVVFDGRLPYITSVTPPANATYAASQNLNVVVNFDRAVTVTGSPYIELTIGSATRQATYLSGTGTTALTFRYTTIPGDEDLNGITIVNTITQNAGNITGTAAPTNSFFQFPLNNTFVSPNTTGVIVNAPLPKPISIVRNVDSTIPIFGSATADNVWMIGQDLLFTVGFNTNMYVNQTLGTPRIPITVGATTRYATYLSGGNGQASLLFRYVIQEGDFDTDTNIAIASIDLNGGNITDVDNTNSLLNFPVTQVTTTSIDGVRPTISTVTPPPNASYSTVAGNNNANMTFTMNWSEAVNLSTVTPGSLYLPLNIGGTSNNAQYTSGSNTAAILLNPGSLAAQFDNDGVALSSPAAGSAAIKDRAGNEAAIFTYTPPVTTGVLVDALVPLVTGTTPPANATYIIGQNLDFVLTFSEAVTVAKSGGYPRIPITIGSTVRYLEPVANGTATTHTFRYTIVETDADTNGVAMGNVIQHTALGYVRDTAQNLANTSFTPPTTAAVLVDGIRPTVTLAAPPASSTYIIGQFVDFTFTYSENVDIVGSPRLTLTIGATTRYAVYQSGTGTTSIVFRYTVLIGDEDTNGIAVATSIDLNGGTIKDVPGNAQSPLTFTAPTLTSVRVDGVGPTISAVSPPASSTYRTADVLSFTVTYSEAVTVTGAPTLSLNIGGATRTASYASGSLSNTLVFQYTVIAGDSDTNGVQTTTPLALAGGTIMDAAGNVASLTFTTTVHAGVLVDALAPAITGVTAPIAGAYQNAGTRPIISFTVNYNENVTVVGIPRIHLIVGSTTRYATFASGSGTAALVFSYPVVAADLDLDGIAVSNSSNIDLNAGTMMDGTSNNAAIALGAVSTSRVTVVYPSLRNWYDLSDTASLTLAAGPTVTGLADRIGTLNLTHTGATYAASGFNGGSSGFATCTSASNFDSTTPENTIGFIAVFKAPTVSSGYLVWVNNASQPMLEFATLNSANLGIAGGQYSGGAFGSTLTIASNFWTSNSGAYYLRAVKWDTPQNRRLNICEMNGQLAEFIMFNTIPTSAELTQIEAYISAKHGGLVFPP